MIGVEGGRDFVIYFFSILESTWNSAEPLVERKKQVLL